LFFGFTRLIPVMQTPGFELGFVKSTPNRMFSQWRKCLPEVA